MPKCGNCGSHVTKRYVRVHKPRDLDRVRTCPDCELVRVAGNEVRERAHLATAQAEIADDETARDWSEVRS